MEVSGEFYDPELYPQGRSPRYPLCRRLGGPQSRSAHGREDRKIKGHYCLNRELNHGRPARSLVPILTELPRLIKNTNYDKCKDVTNDVSR
jgi:hypothetical protein